MTAGWRELTLKDILYGVVVPLIVGLIIIAFPLSQPLLMGTNPALIGILVFGIAEVILIVAIPMLLGLLWNQWAGGASGFLLGSIYALWWSDGFLLSSIFAFLRNDQGGPTFGGGLGAGFGSDISLLGYVVSAMLIGYMAGALNKRSYSFSKMLVSGTIAGVVGALFLFLTYQLSPYQLVTGGYGFFITIVPRIAVGILAPIIAKFFTWFGITPRQTN